MNALIRFMSLVANELGGTVVTQKDHLELHLEGEPPVIVPLNANRSQFTQERLRLVEKQAAIALLSDPAYFTVTVTTDTWKRCRKTQLMRVAFGLYIVNGVRCFQRYTAYYEAGSGLCAVLLGDDAIFSRNIDSIEQRRERSKIKASWPKIGFLYQVAYKHFINSDNQVQQFQALSERQKEYLFDLNLLYSRKSKRHIRTHGVDLNDCNSHPSSATDEFQRRKANIMSRYIPQVGIMLLSTGVVTSPARRCKEILQMPFIPSPEDKRWLMCWENCSNKLMDNDKK